MRPTFDGLTAEEIEQLEDILEDEEELEEDDEEELDRGDFLGDDEDEELEDDDSEEDDEEDEDDEEVDEDEEDEEDYDDSEDEDVDEDDDEDEDRGNSKIPRGRLNEVIRQRDEERERAAWLEEQLEKLIDRANDSPAAQAAADEAEEALPDYDFDAAEEKYIELLLEGETKEASALRREINKNQNDLYEAKLKAIQKEASSSVTKETKAARDQERFDDYIAAATAEHDFLDADSENYNERAVKMANQIMAGYMVEGKSKYEAIKAAVEDIIPLFSEKPTKSRKSAKPGLGDKEKRTRAARKKASDASRRQPPNTGRKGGGKGTRDLEELDVSKLSERDFDKLTAKEKAVLRGD